MSVMLGTVVAKRVSRSTHFNAASGPSGFRARAAGAITFIATIPMPASVSRWYAGSFAVPTAKL